MAEYTQGGGEYKAGSRVTVSAKAPEGYDFIGWYIGENQVSEDAEYTFIVENDVTLYAYMKRKSYTVTVLVPDGGGTTSITSGIYNKGEIVTITATPDDGYKFQGWYINNERVSYKRNYEFEVDSNIEISAIFSLSFSRLPNGFIEIEYIEQKEGIGSSIVTYIYNLYNIRIELDLEFYNTGQVTDAYYSSYTPSSGLILYYDCNLVISKENVYAKFGGGKRISTETEEMTNKKILTTNVEPRRVQIDMNSFSKYINFGGESTFFTNSMFPQWNMNRGLTILSSSYLYGKLFYCKISRESEVLKEYIPCIRKEDGIIGLYDLANDYFYEGNFVAGPEV